LAAECDNVPDLAEDDEVEDGQDAERYQVDEEQVHPVNVDLKKFFFITFYGLRRGL
jgi:hypothetical protein